MIVTAFLRFRAVVGRSAPHRKFIVNALVNGSVRGI